MNAKKVIAALLLCAALPVMGGAIDFGQAGDYNAFIKDDFSVTSSDVQGRIAVGGNMTVAGGYDVGYRINQFGMGQGPTLVVGGDVVKSGPGFLNVYEAGEHQSPHSGELVYAGTVSGGPIEANLTQVNPNALPVDFDSAFSQLTQLSNELAARTATGSGVRDIMRAGAPLVFTPDTTPDDNVYVFNVTQEQINANIDWFVEGVSEDATVIFNLSNPNAIAGKNNWAGGECAAGEVGCVQLSQTNISVNGQLLSEYVNKDNTDNRLPSQVLFNFAGASQVNLATDLYASVLAPQAAIHANPAQIYGQVIGKSWQGNMQINYDPFTPVGSNPPPQVSEPQGIAVFLLSLVALLAVRRLQFPPQTRQFAAA
ncbi:choice-of-anchor A family protein [Lacimicrobium alkaliphilum]|uniref:Choice-of-anchor A domain-containing protein n=1 Tax=Lacimicrobium alkaliphilum TaxID=1526571 RepID=A0ABQ1R102_9ALTE|nr:choice-of-anchor A family protein [Lacimicrobium alkaliphilum]GGD51436.1 hypothetical protein GCM10011357_04180 [Lacimicrobium alkaliphilum]